jgi:NDP-sugar pyrophosphorylase family protein
VGFRGELFQEYAGGSRLSLQLDYSFDGPRLLGTAGAIRQALPLLGEAFFVLYGDS